MISIAAFGPVGICKGGDDAIWFVEIMGNKIGRITASGNFTEYSLPTQDAKPHAIVSGKEGELWFTEECGKIGQLIY